MLILVTARAPPDVRDRELSEILPGRGLTGCSSRSLCVSADLSTGFLKSSGQELP